MTSMRSSATASSTRCWPPELPSGAPRRGRDPDGGCRTPPGRSASASCRCAPGATSSRTSSDATDAHPRGGKRGGADYVQTPEMTTIMELDRARLLAGGAARSRQPGAPALPVAGARARHLAAHRLDGGPRRRAAGSPTARSSSRRQGASPRATTRSTCSTSISAAAKATAKAPTTSRAASAVLADLPWGQLGLTICYDLRFPHLYRALAHAGARFLAVPAAFTGRPAWRTGTRCCAPAPSNRRPTCSPRRRAARTRTAAKPSATASSSRPGARFSPRAAFSLQSSFADVELQLLEDVRRRVPSLQHDRPFDVVHAAEDAPDKVAS